MDRNDARKAAEVMLAYADGKEIEWCQKGCDDDWRSIVIAHFDCTIATFLFFSGMGIGMFKDK